MTTYTATVSKYDETFTMRDLTTTKIKSLRKDGYTVVVAKVAAVKSEPIKFYYYRGEMVVYIEGRQNGYTLVYNPSTGQHVFANTTELEYR